MVLQSHVEIKRVPPVPEADADESTPTAIVLYPQDEISAGVTDRFHGDAGVLFHRRLGEQLS